MKILLLNDDFPPYARGGSGSVAYNLAVGFRKAGHEVGVITTVRDAAAAGAAAFEGLTIHRLHSDYPERWRGYIGLYNPATAGAVSAILKEFRPDVVHAHNIHYHLSYHCLKLAKRVGAKVFLTAHDVMLFHYGKLTEHIDPSDLSCPEHPDYRVTLGQLLRRFRTYVNPCRGPLIRHYLKFTDGVFAVSAALKDALERNGIRGAEVIHNGIDADLWRDIPAETARFSAAHGLEGKKVVLCSGRMNTAKGRDQIDAAMKIVRSAVPEAALLVAGGKDFKGSASSEGGSILTDWLTREELRAAVNLSRVIAIPSVCFDSFPTVALEAMACAKPVVATCFGGAKELVLDGRTGYVLNPYDVKKLAAKIVGLLQNQAEAEAFGAAGLARVVSDFSLSSQVELTLLRYQAPSGGRNKD